MRQSVAGTWHVNMQVDGIDAVCSAQSGVCEWQSLSSETPTVETISPFTVSEGSVRCMRERSRALCGANAACTLQGGHVWFQRNLRRQLFSEAVGRPHPKSVWHFPRPRMGRYNCDDYWTRLHTRARRATCQDRGPIVLDHVEDRFVRDLFHPSDDGPTGNAGSRESRG